MAYPVQNQTRLTGVAGGVTLDTEGRPNIEVYVEAEQASDYNLWGSNDSTAWRLLKSAALSLSAAGRQYKGYFNGYRYVNIGTYDVGNHFIEITAGG